MPRPRVLLLLICPLLLLSLAGPLLAAAQAPAVTDTDPSREADQEALRATVAEQAREVDRLSGKVDGLQTSLDSAAKASEAATREAAIVVRLVEWVFGLAVVLIAVAGYFGYGKFNDILNKAKSTRDEAADHAKEVADCAQKVRDALKSIEGASQKATEYLDRIKHYADEAQTEAHKDPYQWIQPASDMSEEEKQGLAELAARLDVVEALGLPLEPESYFARGNAYYTKEEYERAAQCYEKATQLRSDYHQAWNNWGTALSEQANTKDGPEADSLFEQSYGKYARAVDIKPDKHEAWSNWGNALSDQANTKDGPEADSLFEQSYGKYARAVEIKPDDHEAWSNWGAALSEQAKTKQGPDADHEAWYNWGTALTEQAKTKDGADADSLFQQAREKYARAVQIKPDFHEGWNNWGTALLEQAKTKQGPEAGSLFHEAGEKFGTALRIKPDFANGYFNRACVRSLQGNVAEALADLNRAINLDPQYRQKAKTDPDLEPLHSDPDFRKLVGLDPEEPEANQP